LRTDAVKRPLERPYKGPYKVLRRGHKTFVIQYGDKEETVSVDRLKPVVEGHEAAVPAVPPRRGRPKKAK